MKYNVKKEILDSDLKWLEEKNNALNDYGVVVRHLLNEVSELKKLLQKDVCQGCEESTGEVKSFWFFRSDEP